MTTSAPAVRPAPAPDAPPAHAVAGPSPAPPESCVKYFDALWFCYSPGHQLRQYYRYGNVDDCTTTWSSLWACLGKRTTRFADSGGGGAPAAPAHPLWRLRSPEAARAAWTAEFGGGGEDGENTDGR